MALEELQSSILEGLHRKIFWNRVATYQKSKIEVYYKIYEKKSIESEESACFQKSFEKIKIIFRVSTNQKMYVTYSKLFQGMRYKRAVKEAFKNPFEYIFISFLSKN